MKINFRKFQMGGEMAAPEEEMGAMPEEGAPEGAEAGGGDPLMQLVQMAMQALQSQDCNAAMQVCQAFVELAQQAQGGGGAPVYRKGGVLVRRKR